MITPQQDLELSIKALTAYGVHETVINNMLSNLNKIIDVYAKLGLKKKTNRIWTKKAS